MKMKTLNVFDKFIVRQGSEQGCNGLSPYKISIYYNIKVEIKLRQLLKMQILQKRQNVRTYKRKIWVNKSYV